MNLSNQHSRTAHFARNRKGFALVIALSLMAFILLLAMAMTSFTRVETQASNIRLARMHAQQNAILGLKVAVGELQRLAGPDQRITAPASVFDATPQTGQAEGVAQPHLVAVFESSDPIEVARGNDNLPQSTRSLDGAGSVGDRLAGWLISSLPNQLIDPFAALGENNSMLLGTFEDADGDLKRIRAPKVPFSDDGGSASGSFAWWASDESLKGRIDLAEVDNYPDLSGAAEDSVEFLTSQRSDLRSIDNLSSLGDKLAPTTFGSFAERALSIPQLMLYNQFSEQEESVFADWLQRNFLDLTLHSSSVPANVATGRLKEDLSAYLEGSPSQIDDNDLIIPGGGALSGDLPRFGLIKSWYQAGQSTALPVRPRNFAAGEHGVHPIVLRVACWFKPAFKSDGELILKIHPFFVLWNPYDRPMEAREYLFLLDAPIKAMFERGKLAVESNGLRQGATTTGGTPSAPEHIYQLVDDVGGISSGFDIFNWLNLDVNDSGSGFAGTRTGHEMKPFAFVTEAAAIGAGETRLFSATRQSLDNYSTNAYRNLNSLSQILSNPNRMQAEADTAAHFTIRTGLYLRREPGGTGAPPLIGETLHTTFYTVTGGAGLAESQRDFSYRLYAVDGANARLLQDFDNEEAGSPLNNPAQPWFNKMEGHPWQATKKTFYGYGSLGDLSNLGQIHRGMNSIPFNMKSFSAPANRWQAHRPWKWNFRTDRYFVPKDIDWNNRNYVRRFRFFSAGTPTQPWFPNGGGWRIPATQQGNDGLYGFFAIHSELDQGANYAFFNVPGANRPLVSLGELQNMNFARYFWEPSQIFGQSEAFPFIARDEVEGHFDGGGGFLQTGNNAYLGDGPYFYDLTYMLNASIWDRFFLSTRRPGGATPTPDFQLSNARHSIVPAPTPAAADWGSASEQYDYAAANLRVDGALNVNSTSKTAWKAILGGTFGRQKDAQYLGQTNDENRAPFAWSDSPLYAESVNKQPDEEEPWGSIHSLNPAEIDLLAGAIVEEVKRRGPFFSLGDFFNRRLVPDGNDAESDYLGLKGAIQAAIDKLSLRSWKAGNDQSFNARGYTFDSGENQPERGFTAAEVDENQNDLPMEQRENIAGLPEGEYVSTYAFGPAHLDQGDILTAIGPFLTARGDTFVVRTGGEYADPITGETVATAFCEAVVQRIAKPVDPVDDVIQPLGRHGRKFVITRFRWLSSEEVGRLPINN